MSSANAYVSKILIYPIKSLDAVKCDRATVLESGALKGDRTWAIVDRSGNFVNGKRNQKVHSLRSQFDLETNSLSLQIQGTDRVVRETWHYKDGASSDFVRFNLVSEQQALCNWLEDYFGFPVEIKQNLEMGFPDDTVSPGATIVSTATLEAIADWYPELTTEDIRRRFRTNIEIAGVPAFWEDRLFTTPEQTVRETWHYKDGASSDFVKFKVGDVEFMGVNPCQRCVVVTRSPQTGQSYPKFQKTFIQQRKNTLPEWTERSRFNHYFRLAVNTRLAPSEAGKAIAVGDRVMVLG